MMPVESWIAPEEAPALAAAASEMIDGILAARGDLGRDVFWATIRKAYNTPYNPPEPKKSVSASKPEVVTVRLDETPPLPIAAMAMAVQAAPLDQHAA